MLKMRAPEGVSFSHEGRSVEPDKEGAVHVQPRDLDTFKAHGFVPWEQSIGADANIEAMTRDQLINAACERTRTEAAKMETEKIRDALRGSEREDDRSVPTEAELAGVQLDGVDEKRIATMNRRELFAYLKAEKVSAVPPITNDKLREIALDTLKRKRAA